MFYSRLIEICLERCFPSTSSIIHYSFVCMCNCSKKLLERMWMTILIVYDIFIDEPLSLTGRLVVNGCFVNWPGNYGKVGIISLKSDSAKEAYEGTVCIEELWSNPKTFYESEPNFIWLIIVTWWSLHFKLILLPSQKIQVKFLIKH